MSTEYLLALTRIPGVGAVLARTLLSHFGAAEAIFNASYKHLLHVEGIALNWLVIFVNLMNLILVLPS